MHPTLYPTAWRLTPLDDLKVCASRAASSLPYQKLKRWVSSYLYQRCLVLKASAFLPRALMSLVTSLQAEEAGKGNSFINNFLSVHTNFRVKGYGHRHVCSFANSDADASKGKAMLRGSGQIDGKELLEGPTYYRKNVLIPKF